MEGHYLWYNCISALSTNLSKTILRYFCISGLYFRIITIETWKNLILSNFGDPDKHNFVMVSFFGKEISINDYFYSKTYRQQS